jgi:hypothetical protein
VALHLGAVFIGGLVDGLKTGSVIQIWHSGKIKIRSNGKTRLVHLLTDAPEEVCRFSGHGACVLKVGDGLTFRESVDGAISDINFDISTPECPEVEDSQIVDWHHVKTRGGCSYGFAKRQCSRGCRIYCREDDVITEGSLGVGTWIQHAVEEQYGGRMKATRISIYQP